MNDITEIQITHIRGGSYIDHRAIEAYQWIVVGNGQIGNGYREDVVAMIRNSNGKIQAFVQVGLYKAYCKIMVRLTTNYLETYPDSTRKDNLLSLPQF